MAILRWLNSRRTALGEGAFAGYARDAFAGLVALISAFWVAICAAAPEFIWQGLRIGAGHFSRAEFFSALLLGLILAFFVEPLIRRAGDLLGPYQPEAPEHRRNPLFTAGLSLAFALVSVSVHEAMSAFVSGRGPADHSEPSGLNAAIALTAAWSIVPFAITLAWLSARNRRLREPMGLVAAASAGIAGWLFSWSRLDVITTAIPCLLILGLGYRRVIGAPERLAFLRCAPVVALVGAGWLIGAWLACQFLGNRTQFYTTPQLWVDARFYLGWALGLLLAPSPSPSRPQPK